MSTTGVFPPDQTTAFGDPGDDTARRYRFQYTWAAIVCCMLLDDTQDIVEVFCEHHEDVLLKHRDGKFTGQQVKTRELNQPLWKAGEAQVKMTCARFVQLDMRFPGYFRAYRFLTCHPFYVANNSQSLGYVLAQINAAPNIDDLPSSVRAWLRRVAREAEASETLAFDALKKATASVP
jgi:hypothetical protein